MIFILLSILTASSFGLLFKYFERHGLDAFQVIVVNYLTACIVGMLTIWSFPFSLSTFLEAWFPYAVVLGSVFFYSFNLIAKSIAKAGISATMVAAKMSLVIPTFAGVLLFGEGLGWYKVIGIVIALGSVWLTLSKPCNSNNTKATNLSFLPLVIFVVGGLQDTLFGYNQRQNLNPNNFEEFTIAVFFCAFAAGLVATIYKLGKGTLKFESRNIAGGIAIGIPNYFSIFFLVQALELPGFGTSVIFPVLNIGIIAFSAIAALVLFKEKLFVKNWIGVGLALVAIFLMSRG